MTSALQSSICEAYASKVTIATLLKNNIKICIGINVLYSALPTKILYYLFEFRVSSSMFITFHISLRLSPSKMGNFNPFWRKSVWKRATLSFWKPKTLLFLAVTTIQQYNVFHKKENHLSKISKFICNFAWQQNKL